MPDQTRPQVGSIGWMDLTVENAERVRKFYQFVTGWTPDPVDMGGYNDYVMCDEAGTPVSGVCHKRGVNAALPSVWLVYITVADLDESLEQCRELGGKVLSEPASGGQGRYAVIEDPAGAVCALFESSR